MPGRIACPDRLASDREAGAPDSRVAPDDGLVAFATQVARASPAERLSFHAGYRSEAADPGIDRLEVITELRRLVLLAELRGTANSWTDADEARQAVEAFRGKLTVEARVRFHPQRGYTALPRLVVQLGSSLTMQTALHVHAQPVYDRDAGDTGRPPAVVGAVIEATFAAPAVRGVHALVIHVDGVYLLVGTIDLTRMP